MGGSRAFLSGREATSSLELQGESSRIELHGQLNTLEV
jgi:hypothetical protein